MTGHWHDEPERRDEELAALLAGELDLVALRSLTVHLRGCAACRSALVEVAAGAGALRYAARATAVAPAVPAAPAAPRPRLAPVGVAPVASMAPVVTAPAAANRPGPRARLALAAAAAIVAVALIAGALLGVGRGSPTSTARATLRPVGAVAASGAVRMVGSGRSTIMTVHASLPPAPTGSYYEVWLLQPASGHMVALGVLPGGSTAQFAIPAELLGRYQVVDISLQPDNGRTVHADSSLLRATYA